MSIKSKKKKKNIKKKSDKELNYEDKVLQDRNVFINEGIRDKVCEKIIKQIIALDTINHKPIKLYLNSPGGSVSAGFALINVMKSVKSPIITIINSEVCSMGGHISVAGDERWITENGVWMAHDMTTGIVDYSKKIEYRAKFIKEYYKLLEENLKKYTKLTPKQIDQARDGELWLFAKDCVKSGIVDKII